MLFFFDEIWHSVTSRLFTPRLPHKNVAGFLFLAPVERSTIRKNSTLVRVLVWIHSLSCLILLSWNINHLAIVSFCLRLDFPFGSFANWVSVSKLAVILPLMVQFLAQTTCPSDRAVWFGGKFRLILKVAAAPVRVGPSFIRSKVTSPPGNGEDAQ